MRADTGGIQEMPSDELEKRLAEVLEKLRQANLKAEYWHSGGGIWGVMIWLQEGRTLFWAPIDGKWSYEFGEADGDFITGASTDIDVSSFDDTELIEAISSSIRAFSSDTVL